MDKIDYDRELDLMIDIAEFNDYKKIFILKLVRKHKWARDFKKITMLEKETVDKKRSALIYIPTISNKISKVFKKYNVDIVSSKNNNLKSLLENTKDKIKNNDKSGIYSIHYCLYRL